MTPSVDTLAVHGKRPVFVVGHPRSGTTLVQLLITAHPSFSTAPETHFFSHVLEHTPNWEARRLQSDELPKLFARLAAKPGITLDAATQAHIQTLASEQGGISPAVFLDTIMATYATGASTRWLEKTPRHVNFTPQILAFFPDARIINIVRDPRDVVSSNVRYQKLSPEADQSQRHAICIQRSLSWNKMVRFAQQLQPTEARMMTIRYEDLIIDTVGSLERVMQFLGEESHADHAIESFSSNYDKVALEKEVHKQLCAVGEIVDRRGIWKKRMTPEEAQIVDTLCADLMRDYDYQIEHALVPVRVMFKQLRYELPQNMHQLYRHSRQNVGRVLRRLGLR